MLRFWTLFSVVFPLFLFSQEKEDTTMVEGGQLQMVQVVAEKIDVYYISGGYDFLANHSLDDLANTNASTFVKSYGAGQLATLSFRGLSAAQSSVAWNGLQINSPMLGQTDLSLFNLNQVDYIGFSAPQTNIGGQLDIRNNVYLGQKKYEFSLENRMGSFGQFSTAIQNNIEGKKVSSETGFNISYARNDFRYDNPTLPNGDNLQLDNAEVGQIQLAQSFAFSTKKSPVEIHYLQTYANRELPPTLFETNSTESQEDRLYALTAQYEYGNYDKWNGKIQTGYVFQRTDFYISDVSKPDISKAGSWQTSLRLNKRFGNGFFWDNNVSFQVENASSINFEDNPLRQRGQLSSFLLKRFNTGFRVGTGLSQQWAGKDFSYPLPNILLGFANDDDNIPVSVLIEYSQHQRFPTFNDLYWNPGGNENLEAEHSHNVTADFSMYGSFGEHYFQSKTTMFHILADDYIQWQPTGKGYWSPSNVGKIYSRGWEQELFFKLKLKEKITWNITANYGYTRTTNRDAEKSYQLIYVPFHRLSFHNKWETKYINWSINQRVVSENFVTADNTASIDKFYLFDCEIGRDFEVKKCVFSLDFEINNLFNKEYQTVINRPMMGRNFALNLGFKFVK
ncbi:MAG: TonB-dependent receptor plug domain-containing protein [Chitinophagales bacterium]